MQDRLSHFFILFPMTVLSLALNQNSYANEAIASGWWATLEAGSAFVRDNGGSTTEDMPGIALYDDYVTTHIENSAILGAGLGYSFELNAEGFWFPSHRLGIYYDYYFPEEVSGEIHKYDSITAYTYNFDVHSNTLWLDEQLDLFNWGDFFIPFVEISIGAAWNTSQHYAEKVVPDNPVAEDRALSAAFENHSISYLAWRVGVGTNIILPWYNNNLRAGILWRYSDRGDAKTGPSQNYSTMNDGLSSELRSNEVLATLSLFF